ncbi:hypothetical protein ACFGVR_12930 [Mucilaginibacter sp. AW1-3]
MAFEDIVKHLTVEYLKISDKEVLEIELINAVGYSGGILTKVVALIESNNLEALTDDELNDSDNPDTLSVYQVTLLNNKHMVLIFEPYESYTHARILKIVEIKQPKDQLTQ